VRTSLADAGEADAEAARALRAREARLSEREARLVADEEIRLEEERRAADAMARLAALASVREDGDASVVALSCETLFAPNDAEVRARGHRHLRAVASAVGASAAQRRVRLEVVDARRGCGGDDPALWWRRSRAIRRALVDAGVDPARLSAPPRAAPAAERTRVCVAVIERPGTRRSSRAREGAPRRTADVGRPAEDPPPDAMPPTGALAQEDEPGP
jgi:outer membrane protein OmpA-like peptidoglycan-associated protein